MVRGPQPALFCITAWLSDKRAVLERPYGAVKSFRQWFNWGRLKCPPQEGLPFKGQPGLAPLPSAPPPSAPPPRVALPPASPLCPLGPLPCGSLQTEEVIDSLPGTLWPACLGGFRPSPWTIGTICSHSLVSWLSQRRRAGKAEFETQRAPELAHPEHSLSLPQDT